MEVGHLVIVEEGEDGAWGAYVPDLPGCTSIGNSEHEVAELINDSIGLWIETASRHGWEVPKPRSAVLRVAV